MNLFMLIFKFKMNPYKMKKIKRRIRLENIYKIKLKIKKAEKEKENRKIDNREVTLN